MKIKVLGCSGGIGDGRHTTSFLVDDDILVDAGTGVTRLTREALARIDHVFLTHSHLDHILCLPLLLDSVAGGRGHALVLHAPPEVLGILQDHLFNWRIWPDFSRIPSVEAPYLHYAPLEIGVPVCLGDREITALPANHVVPAVGYLLHGGSGSLLFSGDTASHSSLWELADATADLKHLIVECSFPKAQEEVARASKHYCPEMLAADLALMRPAASVWITHLKPGGEAGIMAELEALAPGRVRALEEGMEFDL
ncbi:MAG: 3',5'-cyclic-nucleotide phosphodiesterase [Hydrogenophilales bacterium CG17_big_fil_post_rev_8_21_14_2_50_63_12]|nr:MAG: 3',5'-cyclic-nucleotide phosphodiesterase [Hydrogenophilales bacterium CG17_big_fil_post_rev_8_21_14_2_50_63_12]PJB06987.1 MAG: 3',5'-cyclic-nucleotide phosphodiesterase [Hydrogenophilales bacterium CG_4_9_14_3_um_filter_63_34]